MITTPTLALCVQHSNAVCAHVLYRLLYWVTKYPEKTTDGYRWNANPSSWWAVQTGLSVTQVDRAFRTLKKLGVIVVEARPRMNLFKVRWVRLSDDFEQIILANLDGGSSAFGETSSAASEETGPANSLVSISKGSSKGELKAPIPGQGAGEMAIPLKLATKQEGLNPESLHDLWKAEVKLATGNWVADFSGAEWKFAAALIKKTAGQNLAAAIKAAVQHWGDFRYFVAKAKGLDDGKVAASPQIFTVMQHPAELIAFAKKVEEDIAQEKKWAEGLLSMQQKLSGGK